MTKLAFSTTTKKGISKATLTFATTGSLRGDLFIGAPRDAYANPTSQVAIVRINAVTYTLMVNTIFKRSKTGATTKFTYKAPKY